MCVLAKYLCRCSIRFPEEEKVFSKYSISCDRHTPYLVIVAIKIISLSERKADDQDRFFQMKSLFSLNI